MERLGLIVVDMEYATAEITGDKEFFYGDNNSIEITIENATEEIGDVCYFCANQLGQLYVGNTTLVDGKYVIDKENMDYILNEAVHEAECGVQVLDVNVGLPGINECEMLTSAVTEIQAIINLPLQIDTADPVSMESALRRYNGIPLLNSVNGK